MLQPNLQYSVLVGLSSTAQSGRVILVMDKNFCTDSAGNKFERNKNSNFTLHFGESSFYCHRIFFPNRQYVSLFSGRVISEMSFNCYSCFYLTNALSFTYWQFVSYLNWIIWTVYVTVLVWFDWLVDCCCCQCVLYMLCSLILQIDEVST